MENIILGPPAIEFFRDAASSCTCLAVAPIADGRGALGVPTFFVGEQLFRDDHRLPLTKASLKGGFTA